MKKLTFALAVASALAVFAEEGDGVLNSIGFEQYTAPFTGLSLKSDTGAEGAPSESYWLGSAEDASTVKAYGGDNLAIPTGNMLSGELGSNYLELSTEGGTLWRSINTLADSETLGEAVDVEEDTDSGELYIDTMVQFTPTEDGGDPEVANADKLAIWLNVDSSGNEPATNLCVRAGYIDDQGGVTPTTYVIQNATVDAGSWYRLTVKAVPDITAGDEIPGFIVYLDGTKLVADKRTLDEAYSESDYLDGEIEDLAVFASLQGCSDPTVQGVGFKGSGALDDLVFTTENPLPAPGEATEFTVSIPADAAATYAVGDGAAAALPADGKIAGPAGAAVTVTITLADGTVAVKTGTISANGALDLSTPDWSFYLAGAGTEDDPYVIPNATELFDLQRGVAAGLTTSGKFFQQTEDIDMANAGVWNGIGDPSGAEAANTGTASAFEGTYDGSGKTISNLVMTQRKGSGLFNLLRNATVKELTIDTVTYANLPFTAAKLGGAMLAGNVCGNTTIDHVITTGSNGTQANPPTYNAAGLVNRIEGYQGNVLIKGCTNSATIYCAYSKVAGFCPIFNGVSGSGKVTFQDCANTGLIKACGNSGDAADTLSGKVPGCDGVSGLVAYTQGCAADERYIEMVNCVNTGTLEGVTGSKLGNLLASGGNGKILAATGCSGLSAYPPYVTKPDTITGVDLAYIADGMAEYYALDAMYDVIMAKVDLSTGVVPGAFYSYDLKVTATGMALVPASLVAGTFTADAGSPATTEALTTLLTPFLSKYNGKAGEAGAYYDLNQTGTEPAVWQVGAYAAQVGSDMYFTLADAVTAAADGATIEILADIGTAGTLVDLELSKSLTLVAANGATPTIRNYNFLANAAGSAIAVSNLTLAGTTVFRLQQCASFTMENVVANVTPYRAKDSADGHSGTTNKAHPAFIYLGANDSVEGFATTTPVTVVLKNNTICPSNGANGGDAIAGLVYNQYGNVIWGNRMVANGTKIEGNTFYSAATPSTWGSIILMGADPAGVTVPITGNTFYGTTTVYNYQPLDGKVLLSGSGKMTWLSSGNAFNIDVTESPAYAYGVFTIEVNEQARMAIIDDGKSTVNGNAIAWADCNDESAGAHGCFIMLNGVADTDGKYTAGDLSRDLSSGADRALFLAAGYTTEANGDYFRIVSTTPVATWPAEWPADADGDVKAKFADWAANAGVSVFAGNEAAFLLNVAPDAVSDLEIESIVVDGDTATVVVSAGTVDLEDVNGVLYVEGSDDLVNWTATEIVLGEDADFVDGKATFEVEGAKFMKAKIGFKTPVQQ